MAATFAYTSVPNSLRQFLKGIPSRAVPSSKVDGKYLASIGLKGLNDKSIITVLKFVNLLDGGGSPTNAYKQFRDKSRGPNVLAEQIRSAYKSLYDTYEDAEKQSDDNLRDFFSANTSVGKRAIDYIVASFKVLAEFGDFSSSAHSSPTTTEERGKPSGASDRGAKTSGPQIHINLQVYLPDCDDPTRYDAIFEAIARRLAKLV